MADIFIAPEKQEIPIQSIPANDTVVAEQESINQDIQTQKANETIKQDNSTSFSTLKIYPHNVKFDSQEANEEVLLFLRKHIITNVPWILITLFLILVPPILYLFLRDNQGLFPQLSQINVLTPFILSAFYYLVVLTFIFINFITWYYNISLVTQERVLDIDYSGIVYKNISATKMSLVEDVSFKEIGAIRSMFDYGDVLIQTAGTLDNFDLLAVPQPEKIVQFIEELIGRNRQNA